MLKFVDKHVTVQIPNKYLLIYIYTRVCGTMRTHCWRNYILAIIQNQQQYFHTFTNTTVLQRMRAHNNSNVNSELALWHCLTLGVLKRRSCVGVYVTIVENYLNAQIIYKYWQLHVMQCAFGLVTFFVAAKYWQHFGVLIFIKTIVK